MADTKISGLTADTSPTIDDLLVTVHDPAGTPTNRKVTIENFYKTINGLTADGSPVTSTDYVVTYDASAGAAKKVLLDDLAGLTTQGDILYHNATGHARLGAGTAGQALMTGGAGANPSWAEKGYQVLAYGNSFSPADATTYYFGAFIVAPSTTADVKRLYVRRAGTVTAAEVVVLNNGGTQGSNETSTISLRLNNTTDTTLTSSFDVNDASGAVSFFNVTGLSVTVAAGDYFEIKWVTPTWTTNPTSVVIDVRVYIR